MVPPKFIIRFTAKKTCSPKHHECFRDVSDVWKYMEILCCLVQAFPLLEDQYDANADVQGGAGTRRMSKDIWKKSKNTSNNMQHTH